MEIRSLSNTSTGHGSPPVDLPAPPIPDERIEAAALAPGRPDIVRTIDEVVSNYLSMSFAAPNRFGERLEAFVTELTDMLSEMYHAW